MYIILVGMLVVILVAIASEQQLLFSGSGYFQGKTSHHYVINCDPHLDNECNYRSTLQAILWQKAAPIQTCISVSPWLIYC